MLNVDPESITTLPARERVLLTAHRLFYRNGIHATGIDRIIAESGVTKVTFYRHFPSKNDLVLAFLEYRHQRWIAWFTEALEQRDNQLAALIPVLRQWFRDNDFRGCSFINSVGELGKSLTEVTGISRRHKQAMTEIIATLLPPLKQRKQLAQAIALAVDGAIVRAQYDSPENALKALNTLLRVIKASYD